MICADQKYLPMNNLLRISSRDICQYNKLGFQKEIRVSHDHVIFVTSYYEILILKVNVSQTST